LSGGSASAEGAVVDGEAHPARIALTADAQAPHARMKWRRDISTDWRMIEASADLPVA